MSTALNVEKPAMSDPRVFKPRSSNGWVWVGGIGLLLSAACISTLGLSLGSSGIGAAGLPVTAITGILGIAFLLLALWFPTMTYTVDGSRLVLKYGPVLHYTIDLKQVNSIRRSDLEIGIVSSIRFPGLALFNVPYPEVGVVKMCATASTQKILLIVTGSAVYGVTPADEAAFTAELRRGIGG